MSYYLAAFLRVTGAICSIVTCIELLNVLARSIRCNTLYLVVVEVTIALCLRLCFVDHLDSPIVLRITTVKVLAVYLLLCYH